MKIIIKIATTTNGSITKSSRISFPLRKFKYLFKVEYLLNDCFTLINKYD